MTIYTEGEIDKAVRRLTGCTWVKRRNLRKRMTNGSNTEVEKLVSIKKSEIRQMFDKSESEKREHYAEVTKLELLKLEQVL